MNKYIKLIVLMAGILITGFASAYTHVRNLPSDFHPAKCFLDKDLKKYTILTENGITKFSPELQIVGYSHSSYIYHEKEKFLPDGPLFAYAYMCSYVNIQGHTKHIWISDIHKDKFGKRVGTYVLVPASYKKQLIYKGKTYLNWNDWYSDTFFDDDKVEDKYKNFNTLDYFAIETKEVRDATMNLIGYNRTPLYKFRYVGSFMMGLKKYHTWETFAEAKYNSKFFIYTTQPFPPKFEDRIKLLKNSRGMY